MEKFLEKLKALQESNPEKASEFAALVAEDNNEDFVKAIVEFLEINMAETFAEDSDNDAEAFFESAKELLNEAKLTGKAKAAFLKKMGKKSSDSDDEDDKDDDKDSKKEVIGKNKGKDDSDDDSEDDDKGDKEEKKKVKKEAVDMSKIETILNILKVDEAELEEFTAVLKTEIARIATVFAEEAKVELVVEQEKEIAALKDEQAVTIEKYVEKAIADYVESNQTAIIDSEELDQHRSFVESMKVVFDNFNIETDSENSPVLKDLRSDLKERNEKIDEITTSLHDARHVLMLEQARRITTEESAGMTDADKERFGTMLEDINFQNIEDFRSKASKLRTRYFVKGSKEDDLVVENLANDAALLEGNGKPATSGKTLIEAIKSIQ